MRPMCRPSSRARRMPAFTLLTIVLRSSSAIAALRTTTARPSGPLVSIFSPEADELDVETVQLVEHFKVMLHRAGNVPGRFTDETKTDAYLSQSSSDKKRMKTNLDVHLEHVRGSGVIDVIRLAKL